MCLLCVHICIYVHSSRDVISNSKKYPFAYPASLFIVQDHLFLASFCSLTMVGCSLVSLKLFCMSHKVMITILWESNCCLMAQRKGCLCGTENCVHIRILCVLLDAPRDLQKRGDSSCTHILKTLVTSTAVQVVQQ